MINGRGRAAAAWLLAGLGLVGCATVPSTSLPTVGVESTPMPATRAVARDPSGDLVDADGTSVPAPRSMDVTRLEADAIGSDLRLQLTLVGAPPPSLPAADAVASYDFGVDTGGDARPDYMISFATRPDGSFAASLRNQLSGDRLEGSAFPGSIVFQERVILVQLTLSGLGSPAMIKVCAITQLTAPDGRVAAEDNVPDGDCHLGAPTLTLH